MPEMERENKNQTFNSFINSNTHKSDFYSLYSSVYPSRVWDI